MNKSKRSFIIISVIFVIILIILAVDIASRTTFPGKKHRNIDQTVQTDSVTVQPEN